MMEMFNNLFSKMKEAPMETIACVCIMLIIWLIKDSRSMGYSYSKELREVYQKNTEHLIKLLTNTTQQLEATANSNENVVDKLEQIRNLVDHCENRQDNARRDQGGA